MAQAVLELIAKTEGWNGTLKQATNALNNFIKTNKGLHEALANDGQTFRDAVSKFGDLKTSATDMNGRIKELSNSYLQLGDCFRKMNDEEKAANGEIVVAQMRKIRVEIIETKNSLDKLNGSLSLSKRVDPLNMGDKVKKLTNDYLRLGAALRNMSDEEKKIHGNKVISKMKSVQKEVLQTKDAINKLNSELTLTTKKGSFFGDFAQFGAIFQGNIAATAVMSAIRGLGDALRNAVQTNIDFEQSNATLASVLGTTTDKVIALTNNAKYLGATTVWTAGEISELQTILARRGFGENQILNMTKGISSLATATGVGLADAAELAASAMQAFQLPAQKMDDVVATLGVATTKSALDMEKLRYAFAYVAPAAKAAGFSIEEAVSMLGALADAGLPATTAGMATRNVLLDMTDSSSRLAKGLGKPVHSLDEFVAALNELRQKGGNNLETIGKLVDDRVVPAFSVFLNSTDKMIKMREEVTNVRDELQGMVDNQINTMQGSLTLLSSAWDGLMLSFSNSTGPMKVAVDGLTKVINKLTELHNASMGGDNAITQLEKGLSDADRKEQEDRLNEVLKGAMKDGKIDPEQAVKILSGELGSAIGTKKINMSNRDALRAQYDNVLDKEGTVDLVRNIGGAANAVATGLPGLLSWAYGNVAGNLAQASSREEMEQQIADYNDWIAKNQYYIDLLNNAIDENMKASEPNKVVDVSGGKGGKTEAEKAEDRVAAALRKYERTITVSNDLLREEVKTGEQTLQTRINAATQVYNAFEEAYAETNDPKYLEAAKEWHKKIQSTSETLGNLRTQLEEIRQSVKDAKHRLAINRALDARTLNSLMSAVSGYRKDIPDEVMGGQSTMEYFGLSKFKERMTADLSLDIPNEEWEALVKKINEKLAELKLPQIELDVDTGKVTKLGNVAKFTAESFGYVANSITNVGNALQSLENPGAKVTGIIMNAIASIAMGFAQASAADAKYGVLPWIAATTAGAATMASMIASIKEVTQYKAEGGRIEDVFKPRGTDTVPAMLTPGEIVLNAAGQSNVASKIIGAGAQQQRVYVEGRVSGKDILLASNNYNRARGGSRGAYTKIR